MLESEHHFLTIHNIQSLTGSAIDTTALQVEDDVLNSRMALNSFNTLNDMLWKSTVPSNKIEVTMIGSTIGSGYLINDLVIYFVHESAVGAPASQHSGGH